jgi:hypothetical protein
VHDRIAQVVPTHVGVPFWTAQTFPQPPQLETLLVVAVSQPSLGLPLQSPYPAAQVPPHIPLVHVGEMWFVLHARPQPPQLVMLEEVSVSHPFAATPSQSA